MFGYYENANGKFDWFILSSHQCLYPDVISQQKSLQQAQNMQSASSNQIINNIFKRADARKGFAQLVALHQLESAWKLNIKLNHRHSWIILSKKCLQLLEIKLAIAAFRSLQDAANVLLLETLVDEDDSQYVAAYACTLLSDFQTAEKLFLMSHQPILALNMRRNLLQFDRALKLAEKLDAQKIPTICKEYAVQLEFRGEFTNALQLYKRAKEPVLVASTSQQNSNMQQSSNMLMSNNSYNNNATNNNKSSAFMFQAFDDEYDLNEKQSVHTTQKTSHTEQNILTINKAVCDCLDQLEQGKISIHVLRQQLQHDCASQRCNHMRHCDEGIARCTLRIGHVQKGIELALASENKQLYRECASILESLDHLNEAGQLYLKGNNKEKAVQCFIESQNLEAAAPIMQNISTPKLHVAFARAKENEGDYSTAIVSYIKARDDMSVIRLFLDHLNRADDALKMVRENPFAEGAMQIAQFTYNKGDIDTAIEFFVLARQHADAFDLAKHHDKMDTYCSHLSNTKAIQQECMYHS